MTLRSVVQKAGAAAILAGGLTVAAPAFAQTATYVGVRPPAVGAVDATSGAVLSTQGQIAPVRAQARSGGLALTGTDVIGLSTIGAVSIGVGVVAVRSSRRRSASGDTGDRLAAG